MLQGACYRACYQGRVTRRLKRCCEEVNRECDVEGLCQGFPKRIKLLQAKEGQRVKNRFSNETAVARFLPATCGRQFFRLNRCLRVKTEKHGVNVASHVRKEQAGSGR